MLLALLALGLAPRTAWGQRISVIGYAATDGPATGDDVERSLSVAIRRDGGAPVSRPFERAVRRLEQGAVLAVRLDGFRRARQLAHEGWRAYLAVEAAFAASRLAEARRVAARIVDLPGGLELYADLTLRLGVVLLHLQRSAEAAVLFRLARRLTPERLVTPSHYSPSVVTAYNEAARAPQVTRVLVRASVPGAMIQVDGKDAGPSPARLRIEVGQHVVVARAKGFASATVALAVGPGPPTIRIQLEREAFASAVRAGATSLAVGTGERDAHRSVEGLLTYGELDGVLLVAAVWRRGAPALLGQLCRSVPVRCSAVVELGYPRTAALSKASRALWDSLSRVAGRVRFPPTLPSDARLTRGESRPGAPVSGGTVRRRWWKSQWLWAGVGAASVAVGATMLLRGDREMQPLIRVNPCEFGGCP